MSEHAIGNAKAWAETIHEAMTAFQALDHGEAETVTFEGYKYDSADALRERIEEMPLSIQVRDGWRSPDAESDGAEEFEILLSTGGPALRIFGDIGDSFHTLQWQDWGTPWTDYRDTTAEQDEAISEFVNFFCLDD